MGILFSLFFSFFKIGLFGFGGGYAMISLIQREISEKGWMAKDAFADIIAIAQMTPGPISVNSATFIGYELASFPGALVATTAVILPSFILVSILVVYMKTITNSPFTNTVLLYLKPVILALIVNAGITIGYDAVVDHFSLVIFGLSFLLIWKTRIHPIIIIALSGILGMIFYAF